MSVELKRFSRTDSHLNRNADDSRNGPVIPNGTADKKEVVSPVGVLEIFKYSDVWDCLMIVIGVLASIGQGIAFPLLMLVFGDMVDSFVNSENFGPVLQSLLNKYNITVAANATLEEKLNAIKNNVADFDPNSVIPSSELVDKMSQFAIYYTIIGVVVLVLTYIQVIFLVIPAERQTFRIRNLCFRSIMLQEMSWHDSKRSGELNTRLTDDITKIHEGYGDKLGQFFQWMSCCITGFIIGFVKGWQLTLVILSVSPAIVLSTFLIGKLQASFTSRELASYAKAGSVAEEVLGAIRTVAAFGGQQKEVDRYTRNLGSARDAGVKRGFTGGITMGVMWLILFSAYGLGFWYGAKLIRESVNGEYTAGNLLIVFFGVMFGAMGLGQAMPSLQTFNVGRSAAFVIFEIIDKKSAIDSSSSSGLSPASVKGDIELRDVDFTYPARLDVPVMRQFSVTIPCGQTVALVGASGCGKSTTVQLIQRFYDPAAGQVLLDGMDIRELNVAWLRSHLGVVSQEPVLFACSISENVRYGREDVTQEEIEQACREANAYDFIDVLPNKYDTLVGDRGIQLSGGQKQRIAIARALVRNPKILLLDEATSALDTESEATVQAALDKARAGRTTVVVAHRLTTIRTADLIVGISAGRVVECGSHDELLALENGVYQSLVKHQTSDPRNMDESDSEFDTEEDKRPENVGRHHSTVSNVSQHSGQDGMPVSLERTFSDTGVYVELGALPADYVGVGREKTRFRWPWQKGDQKKASEEEGGAEKGQATLPPGGFSRLMALNQPEWAFIMLGILSAFVNGGVMPAFSVIFGKVLPALGNPNPQEQEATCNMYAGLFVVCGVASFVAQFCQAYAFAKSGEALTMRCRHLMFKAMLRQDIAWFDRPINNLGALTTRLATEASKIHGATGTQLGTAFQTVSSLGVGVVLALVYMWKLALVILAFVPFLMIGGLLQMTVMQGFAARDKKALEGAGKVAVEGIENVRTVAGLTREEAFCRRYHDQLHGPHQLAMRKSHLQAISFAMTQAIIFFCYAATFYVAGVLIGNGEGDVSKVFIVFGALVYGAMMLGQANALAPDAGKARAAAGIMFELLDRQPAIDSASTEGTEFNPGAMRGKVLFDNVRFRYPTRPKVPVLRGLNLTAEPGQMLALVGSSGCGKSTVVQLIERFYDPLHGLVLVDGLPVAQSRVSSLRACLGIVSQEPTLFACSVRENIAYGDNGREVPQAEIEAAARGANIHDFIVSLPLGYDTDVGEKGAQLSGGQKQRIAIARALVRNPKILLLDEATSALDTESEKVVQEALDKAQQGRTSLVIAHRLSTIRGADLILVLHAGRVREAGTHDHLMTMRGLYSRLVMTQQQQQQDSAP